MIKSISENSMLRKGLFLSATLFLYLLNSCKEDGTVVPEFNTSGLTLVDTIIEVSSVTLEGDSVLSGNTSRNLLGKLNDDEFGLTESEFYTQIEMSTSSLAIPSSVNFDSVVLYLAYDGNYGFDYEQNVEVYELSEDLDDDEEYYSTKTIKSSDELLGSAKLSVTSVDSFIDTTKVLSIRLNDDLATRIKSEGTFSNQSSWLEFFKGLKVTTSPTNVPSSAGEGSIVYFNLPHNKTKMVLYYNDNDGPQNFEFEVKNDGIRFSHFVNTYSESMKSAFGKEDEQFSFISSMAGVRTKISFPNISTWAGLAPIAINKAEIFFSYEDATHSQFAPPERNVLIYKNDEGNFVLPDDFFKGGSDYLGGFRDLANQQYKFNLASTMHDIINNGNYNRELYLTVSGNAVTASRLKLNSGIYTNSKRKIFLILSYTKAR